MVSSDYRRGSDNKRQRAFSGVWLFVRASFLPQWHLPISRPGPPVASPPRKAKARFTSPWSSHPRVGHDNKRQRASKHVPVGRLGATVESCETVMSVSNPNQPLRQWKVIADELTRETDLKKILELSRELNQALGVHDENRPIVAIRARSSDEKAG
jgi:hypothetical protein